MKKMLTVQASTTGGEGMAFHEKLPLFLYVLVLQISLGGMVIWSPFLLLGSILSFFAAGIQLGIVLERRAIRIQEGQGDGTA